MFDFFGSMLFWIYIGLMFICQFISGIGIYGRGLKRDSLNVFGFLSTIVLAIFTWIAEGFISFIVFIVIWILFMNISTPLIFALLRKMGVEPRDPRELKLFFKNERLSIRITTKNKLICCTVQRYCEIIRSVTALAK